MKKSTYIYLSFFLLTIVFFIVTIVFFSPSHSFKIEKNSPQKHKVLFQDEKDTLDVLLFFHASDYFIYRGSTIGFQNDLIHEMEKALKKHINITVEDDYDVVYNELFKNNYDIIALDFQKYAFISPYLTLSVTHSYSYPVIVTRKIKCDEISPGNLLYIPSYFHHFVSLDSSFQKADYNITYPTQYTTEELFDQVQSAEIDYLVCDYNLAITLLPFYSTLTIQDRAGPDYERCWVLNPNNININVKINNWLTGFCKTLRYNNLYKKYFSPHSNYIHQSNSNVKSVKYKISNFDNIIKKYSKKYDMDWRFVASIIYQESRFVPDLVGYGGSFGLMQMMPETMNYFEIDESADVETQIRAGIRYISMIYKDFSDIPENDRYYFVAASYNAGKGHIFDAQRLCQKYKENSKSWSSVLKYLILKSKSKYANDPVVEFGFYPGKHSVRYAKEVVDRYEAYKVAYR